MSEGIWPKIWVWWSVLVLIIVVSKALKVNPPAVSGLIQHCPHRALTQAELDLAS